MRIRSSQLGRICSVGLEFYTIEMPRRQNKMHSGLIDLKNLLRSIARKLHDPTEIHQKMELRTEHPFYMVMWFVCFGIVWF